MKILKYITVVLCLLSSPAFYATNLSEQSNKNKKAQDPFLRFTNNKLSAIDISCKTNSDCILSDKLNRGCQLYHAVNKRLTPKQAIEFNNEEGLFWITKELSCTYSLEDIMESWEAVCKKNTCTMTKKKEKTAEKECTSEFIQQYEKEQVEKYGIEKKLIPPPPCLFKLKHINKL